MKTPRITPDQEYRLTRLAAWTLWLLSIGLAVLRSADLIPSSLALFVIVFMGFGIYFSLALTRFKQSETMRDVFVAGLTAATSLAGSVEARLKELHYPTTMRDGLPTEVCHECAQRFPCATRRILDGEEVSIATEQALTQNVTTQ